MTDREEVETRCANCRSVLNEPTSIALNERSPCPYCGDRRQLFTVRITDSVEAKSSVQASVSPEPVSARVNIPTPILGGQDVRLDELPDEVIAEALQIGLNLLPLGADQWAIDLEAFGVVGMMTTGELDDAILGVAVWLREFAQRWEQAVSADEKGEI